MTKKRFMIEKSSIVEDGFFICDNTGKFSFPTTKDKSELIMYEKQLNELNNENEQLKSYTGEMEDYLARLEEENEQLKRQNKELEKFRYSVFQNISKINGGGKND